MTYIKKTAVAVSFALSSSCFASVIPINIKHQNLQFTSLNQSMFERGAATVPTTQRAEVNWNKSGTIGGIAGNENDQLPELRNEWTETSTISKQVCSIAGIAAIEDVCKWAGGALKTVTETVTNTYSEVVRQAGTYDTRSGAELALNTSGTLGVESTLGVTSGDVDTSVDFAVDVLSTQTLRKDSDVFVSIQQLSQSTSMQTQTPNITGELNAYMDLDFSIQGKACVAFAGCTDTGSTTLVDTGMLNLPILALNTPEIGDGAALFGFNDYAFDITQKPVHVDAIFNPVPVPSVKPSINLPGLTVDGAGLNVGTLDLDYPAVFADASGSGRTLNATAEQDDIIKLTVDMDTLAAVQAKTAPGGIVANAGGFSVRADAFDISVGPTLDIVQEFSFSSDLYVDLYFSEYVMLNGIARNHWEGFIDDIPIFTAMNNKDLFIDPVFSVSSLFSTKTFFDLDVSAFFDIFKGSVSYGPVTVGNQSSPLFDFSDSFDIAKFLVHENSFRLLGFNEVAGSQIRIAGVPEPTPLILASLTLGAFFFSKRKGKQRQNVA